MYTYSTPVRSVRQFLYKLLDVYFYYKKYKCRQRIRLRMRRKGGGKPTCEDQRHLVHVLAQRVQQEVLCHPAH
jgi:hypothetical protein